MRVARPGYRGLEKSLGEQKFQPTSGGKIPSTTTSLQKVICTTDWLENTAKSPISFSFGEKKSPTSNPILKNKSCGMICKQMNEDITDTSETMKEDGLPNTAEKKNGKEYTEAERFERGWGPRPPCKCENYDSDYGHDIECPCRTWEKARIDLRKALSIKKPDTPRPSLNQVWQWAHCALNKEWDDWEWAQEIIKKQND